MRRNWHVWNWLFVSPGHQHVAYGWTWESDCDYCGGVGIRCCMNGCVNVYGENGSVNGNDCNVCESSDGNETCVRMELSEKEQQTCNLSSYQLISPVLNSLDRPEPPASISLYIKLLPTRQMINCRVHKISPGWENVFFIFFLSGPNIISTCRWVTRPFQQF